MSLEDLRGKYLVIEGIDGSGKSAQTRHLTDSLIKAGVEAQSTFEPGNTPIGAKLREIILDPELKKLPKTEIFLIMADRCENVAINIKPNIENGITVVSDRNWFSTIAYQGFGRDLNVYDIIEQSKLSMGADRFMPDGAVILDVPIDVAIATRIGRTGTDWFEKERKDFFENARRGYHFVAEKFEVPIIDATLSFDEVALTIVHELGRAVLDL